MRTPRSASPKEYYFNKSGTELASELASRVRVFQDYTIRCGLAGVWSRNRAFYENRLFGNSIAKDIIDAGEVGELKAVTFNHYRNILRHMVNRVVAIKPDFQCVPSNTNKDARRSAKIGDDVVHYYYKTKKLSQYLHSIVEKSLVYGDSYLVCEWNPSIGKAIRPDEFGRMVKEGDFQFDDLSPFDVFFNYNKKSKRSWEWVTFRTRVNKYEIAELFPEQRDKIVGLDEGLRKDLYLDFLRESDYESVGEDIYIHSTYHKATNAVPNGKHVIWGGDKENAISLYEGANIYGEHLPVFPLSPATYLETSFGCTEANILRSAQMVLTMAVSAMVTNLSAGSVNNMWSKTGSGMTVEKVTDGMNLLQSDIKPEVINFFQDSPSLANMYKLCVSTMETLSGQNSVVRGNVQDTPNLKSGVALATIINQAQQYSQALEENYFDMFEECTTFMLEMLQKVANTERMYEIAGKLSHSAVDSFTKEDLAGVSRVYVVRTNPIVKMPAGAIEIAENLLNKGAISPDKYFDVVNTGTFKNVMDAKDKMQDYILNVKERLLQGEAIQAIPGINHQMFVEEITSLLFDIDLTSKPENQQVVINITTLISGHMQLLRDGDEIAALIYSGKLPTPQAVSSDQLINKGVPPPNPSSAEGEPQPGTSPVAKPLAGPVPSPA